MNTTKTPAEAAYRAFFPVRDSLTATSPWYQDDWKRAAKAAIEAHLAQVEELACEACGTSTWVDSGDGVNDLCGYCHQRDEIAKLQAERDEALFEKEQAINRQAEILKAADSLQAWKDSMMAVEAEWDEQKLARLLDVSLGQSCRKVISQRLPEILSENEALKRENTVCEGAIELLKGDVEELKCMNQKAAEDFNHANLTERSLRAQLASERDDKLTAIELANKRGEQLRSILDVLTTLGWNGVENSKIASVFLTNYVEEMMATFAKDITQRDAAITELNQRLIERTNGFMARLEEKTKRERYVPIEEHEAALSALNAVLASANPHPRDNGAMFIAWNNAQEVITKLKGTEQ